MKRKFYNQKGQDTPVFWGIPPGRSKHRSWLWSVLCALFVLVGSGTLQAQNPILHLVRDLNGTNDRNLEGSPRKMIEMNGYVYFSAETTAGGRELWRTDGTPSGTEQFDLRPG